MELVETRTRGVVGLHRRRLGRVPSVRRAIRSKENFSVWRGTYPAEFIEFELRALRGEGDTWVAELQVRYEEGGAPLAGVSILHFSGELIDQETIYVAETFPSAEIGPSTPITPHWSRRPDCPFAFGPADRLLR